MGMILKSELVIQGTDKTGAAFAGVIKHAEELKTRLAGLRNMNVGDAGFRKANQEIREQTRLLNTERRAAQEVAVALRAGNEAIGARAGLMSRLQQRMPGLAHATGLGWMVGGFASGKVAHSAAHDVAEMSHERAMLGVSGMSDADMRAAVDKAMRMRVAGMSAADNLRAIGELRTVFGSTEHAIEHAEATQKAAAALKAVNPHMDAEHEAYNLARSLELKGVSNDPERFTHLQNMMVQAINASRGKVTAGDYLSFTNRAGTSTTRTLSDFFYTRVAPTLIQEMTGPTAGRALATMRRQLLGGHMQLQSASEWMSLGLLDPKMVKLDKIGQVKKIKPGAIVDNELFSRDPYAWIQGHLMPAIERKFKKQGKTMTEEAVAAEFATLFSDRYAENMATILGMQKQRIEKDAGIFGGGMGLEAAEYARSHDALAAASDLGASIKTLLSSMAGAKPAIATMNFLSDWAKQLGETHAKYAERHPLRALAETGAVGLGLGYVGLRGMGALFGLTGLTGAGTALTGSAGALTGAAGSLEAAALMMKGMSPGGPVSDLAKKGGGFGLARILGLGMRVLGPAGMYFGSTDAANEGEQDIYRRMPDGSLMLTPFGRSLQGQQLGTGGVPLPPARPNPDEISGAMPPAKAEITGDAKVKVDVEVKTEAGFWSKITSAISNGINNITLHGPNGSTGSRGASMPEATPTGGVAP